MFTMLSAVAQPGIVPTVVPVAGMSLGSFPMIALAPLAFLGVGLVAVLVLLAKEEQARRNRSASRIETRREPSLSEAA
jgi:hypothetical protein